MCKEIGCGLAVTSLMTYTRKSQIIRTEDIKCVGNESKLLDCVRDPKPEGTCTNQNILTIQCLGTFNGYRLVNDSDHCSGRVELLHRGQWKSLCNSHWNLQAANVLCRQLHCGTAASLPAGGYYGATNEPWTDRYHCKGSEYHLWECDVTTLGNNKCPHWDTAGVICTGQKEFVRLMDGESHCAGRLEVLTNDTWSRVVADQWDIKEAEAVCRELHCGDAVEAFPIGTPPVIGGHVTSKRYLFQLPNWRHKTQLENFSSTVPPSTVTYSIEGKDVGVICSESKRLRLVNGPGRCAGRVEVYHQGQWGTICDDLWDQADANVVCKQLNCGYAVTATTQAHYGRGTGKIWMDNVQCTGNETVLWNCTFRQWGQHNCGHKEDSGVICSEFLDLRLVSGSHDCEGRLEVYYNGSWGSVCNNVMPEDSISVICRHLSCGSKGHLLTAQETFGKGNKPFWVDHINCHKGANFLWQCPSSPWNINSCDDRDLARIVCEERKPKTQLPGNCPTSEPCSDRDRVRLKEGANNCSGRVELYYQGGWGTVCDDDWDMKDAEVVCKQVGCGPAMNATGGALNESGTGPIWLSEVNCRGHERVLQDCWALRWNMSDCLHKEDAGVVCMENYPPPTTVTTSGNAL
ncbi:scavenger receptor cysteine-rich type 1 protein M130-like [Mixophyes fleayi]|uniref:scavenger receptor cysteine-rich type 1 protein M130-like n=1 Tax=Mixophyes fleayi TaxID=3061075 RepID=UPI003F4DC178